MVKLSTKVSGMEAVRAEFDITLENSRRQMKLAVNRATERALNIARSNVSGRVLNVRTGKLLGSLGAVYREGTDTVYGKLGTDWYIGRFWERGFKGQQSVRAHFRALKRGNRFELKTMSRRGKVRVKRVFNTGAAPVRAYDRVSDGSARPWLVPALDAVRDSFRRDMVAIARNPNGN